VRIRLRDGSDHPGDADVVKPRFGCAGSADRTDLPVPTFAFVLRAPTCASMYSYSVCWVWCSQLRSYWRSHRGRRLGRCPSSTELMLARGSKLNFWTTSEV